MSGVTARFHTCQPMPWHGRYGRVMGDSGVFHLRYTGGHLWPVLIWETDAGAATCRAIDCAAAVGLVDSVARIKRCFGGGGGGHVRNAVEQRDTLHPVGSGHALPGNSFGRRSEVMHFARLGLFRNTSNSGYASEMKTCCAV